LDGLAFFLNPKLFDPMASLPVIAGQDMDEGLEEMWIGSAQGIQGIDPATENWRNSKLPLAKIKKIMKSEDVILQELERERQEKIAAEEGQAAAAAAGNEKSMKFMISGEAPVLMSKACELMIKDLSFRAWRHTERNRRRTLQKQDLHAAVGESEVYDFLIDIVPRVTTTTQTVRTAMAPTAIPVGMQVAGGMRVPVGLPSAVPQSSAHISMVDNAGMMQLMETAQHQVQQQQPTQYRQDPSQQVAGAQTSVPQNMHQQVQQTHLQQGFATMPSLEGPQIGVSTNISSGQPAGSAIGTVTTAVAGSNYNPNLTITQQQAAASSSLPPNWPSVNQPES